MKRRTTDVQKHGPAPRQRPSRALSLCFAAAISIIGGCMTPLSFDEKAWVDRVETTEASDTRKGHRDAKGRFFNPWAPMKRSGFLRWVLSRDSMSHVKELSSPAPSMENSGDYLSMESSPPSVTSVGHATFVISWDGQTVVTDPFFSKRAAVVRRHVPPAFGPGKIPPESIVVISHNHYDHLDKGSVRALAGKAMFLVPLGLGDYVRSLGAEKVHELDWWEKIEIAGTVLTCLPAQHWSRRFGQGYNTTLWCSWMIERDGRTIYYGGDSGYFKGYREIAAAFPHIDVALLPIGAYEPRWFMHYAHINIAEALRAFEDLGAKVMVPTQWGVLDLGDDPAGWPAVALERALAGTHRHLAPRVKLLAVGEILRLD